MFSTGAVSQSSAEKFYGFATRPFSLSPDLRFAFYSRSHSGALEQVKQSLARREGLVVITGEIGTGKTMLCRTLLETFEEARTFLCVILDPCLSVDDLLRQVLKDFGLITSADAPASGPMSEVTRHQLVETLQAFLASLIPLNANAVIMIDEAQHLSPAVLEQIRLLSNFETDDAKLLQIVLVGQPDLEELLRRDDMRQLSQRIARRIELHPLSDEEVQNYVERRLVVAAGVESTVQAKMTETTEEAAARAALVKFDPPAIQAVTAISRGIPRVINTLCDRALEIGSEQQTRTIDRKIVMAAADRLKLDKPAAPLAGGRRPLAAAAVLVALVGAALTWWWVSRAGGDASGAGDPASPPAAARPAGAANDSSENAPPPTAPPANTGAANGPSAAPPPAVLPGSPAPATPTAASTAATAGGTAPTGYTITVAAFRTPERAAAVASEIAAKGLPARSQLDASGRWNMVLVGPYRSAAEAESAQQNLERDGYADTKISPAAPRP